MTNSPSRQDCPTCGARLEEGEDVCNLCGERISETEQAPSEDSADQKATKTAPADARVYCTSCGTPHDVEANFCSNCGTALENTPASPPEPATSSASPENEGGKKKGRAIAEEGVSAKLIGGIVVAALLLVVGLFVVTAISQESGHTADPIRGEQRLGSEQQGAPGADMTEQEGAMWQQLDDLDGFIEEHENQPIPENIQDDVAEIQQDIQQLEGEERWARQGDLVNLYQGAGLADRAAIEQRKIAKATESTSAWERTGSLMHDWMSSVEGQNRAIVAQLTVDAYEEVLEAQPDNHDARVNMATAYIDTNNPMRGVDEIQRVLEDDPEHIPARFNYAIMQAMIGRVDEAIEQFETVQEYAGEGSPHYNEAAHIIERLREVQEEGSIDEPGAAPGLAPEEAPSGQQPVPDMNMPQ